MSKKTKQKPKYGVISCIFYSLRLMWECRKGVAICSVGVVPIAVILSAISIYLPTIVIRSIETSTTYDSIVKIVIGILFVQLMLVVIKHIIDTNRRYSEHYLLGEMDLRFSTRVRDMDFFLDLDPEIKKKKERAKNAISNNHSAGVHFIDYFSAITIDIICFVMFGAIVSSLNPIVFVILILGCVANFLMAKWQQKQNWKMRDQRNSLNKKINYIAWNISSDLSYGKDIRLFGFSDFIDHLINKHETNWYRMQETVEKYAFKSSFVGFITVLLRDGIAYAFLIYKTVQGDIDASEFVLYFSAISGLSTFLSGILNSWSKVMEGSLAVSDYREFFDIKDKLNRGDGIDIAQIKRCSIEFKNVCYKYPGSDKNILSNVSFVINEGEKIALVGTNGAGKTTITKLMCGLLVPDSGEVLINGYSVYSYNRDDLYKLFSLVPQDFSLLPVSIAENIAISDDKRGEEINYIKVSECVELAGLSDKIEHLPHGVNTLLNRQINIDATDLSGGETQKLLLARALYRQAPILILDEPTAALDPIAEDNMYKKYASISSTCTSIFISHRLASTRFCDRILFMDGSTIAESGSHTDLMELNGKYRELFDVQAKYYREDCDNEKK